MTKFNPALALLLSVALLHGRQETRSCGTYADKWREEVHLHRQAVRSGSKRLRAASAERSAVRSDVGNIALLDDTDGVVARRNLFDLNGRTLSFLPTSTAAVRYRFELGANTYDQNSALAGTPLNGLGDDDSREVQIPFSFPFYGAQYRSVWINSDGNLSFNLGDAGITDRSLGRLTSGPPRIAALFRDLDPTRSSTGARVTSEGSRFVVSWVGVPEYQEAGTGVPQTFQLRLYPGGRIEFAYSDVHTEEAITGIGPGGLQGSPTLVSFATDASQEYSSTVAESFSGTEKIDIFAAAQRFYANHEDVYDYLVFYNNMGIASEDGAVAYEVTVRNNRKGYGDQLVDVGSEAGSKRRLQAILNLGSLDQYPKDPNGRVPARLSSGDTPVTVLAHEAGHLFLAYASVRDPNFPERTPMLGYQSAHWAFTFNSEASIMEGNRIRDNGSGSSPRFQTVGTVEQFAPLDQYLMGLRSPQEVPDTFYVDNARGTRTSGTPRIGDTFDGDRRNVRIDDVVRVAGRRTPDHTVSQRTFRFAIVLITAAGQAPSAEQTAQLDAYRAAFEKFFSTATSTNANAETGLARSLQMSLFPAAGVILGSPGEGRVSIEVPAAAPLTVLLRSRRGLIQPPASVTIPAGSTEASFRFTGTTEGVDELEAEAADSTFARTTAKIQVSASASLQLVIASGDQQLAQAGVPLSNPVQVRVTDVNELPYPGVPVRVAVSGGGTASASTATTDANGVASLRWTPGMEAVNELRFSLDSGPAVTATALGKPAFAASSVVNAASFAPGLTPGGIATIFGANFTGASVFLNDQPVQLFYAGLRQLNFFVPAGTPEGNARVSVRAAAGTSDTVQVPVALRQPGIFFDAGSGYGAVTIASTGIVTQVRPAARGGVVEIYTTGLGALRTAENGLRTTVEQPQVLFGGQTAEVLFSGQAPGFNGLYQINARVPVSLSAGTQNLTVLMNGIRSNAVKVEVQ